MLRWVLAVTFLFSLFLTWIMRWYALARSIIDIPNHRSSHSMPTPRGGGLSFVVSALIAIPFLYQFNLMTPQAAIALMGAGSWVALLGFMDDRRHVPTLLRLLGHFLACLFALYWLGGMPSFKILHVYWLSGPIMGGLACVYLVWLLNLYNFMDGIDGLAAVEGLFVCISGALLYWLYGYPNLTVLPLILAAALLGFLYWNFPPARIFMGDVGSGFLGLILGLLSVQSAIIKKQLFWSWQILLGVFIVDATVTLFFRMLRQEKLLNAHRQHAYQHATRRYNSHFPVLMGVLIINVVWLLPMALLVALGRIDGFTGILIAYTPLIILSVMYKAGQAEEKEIHLNEKFLTP